MRTTTNTFELRDIFRRVGIAHPPLLRELVCAVPIDSRELAVACFPGRFSLCVDDVPWFAEQFDELMRRGYVRVTYDIKGTEVRRSILLQEYPPETSAVSYSVACAASDGAPS